MSRSRVTLATMDAAAIERQEASPLMMERCGREISESMRASSRRACGAVDNWAIAARIAYLGGCRIFRSSVHGTEPKQTANRTGCGIMTAYRGFHASGQNCLQSRQRAQKDK